MFQLKCQLMLDVVSQLKVPSIESRCATWEGFVGRHKTLKVQFIPILAHCRGTVFGDFSVDVL